MENVKVYQLNEYDGVAAESLEQAKEWYLENVALNEEEAFDESEVGELPMDYEVYRDESLQYKQSLKSVIEERWKGEPFLAFACD